MTTLTDVERDELRATARSALGRESDDRWRQMVELGWTAIHVDEEHGGAGCGYGDLAVVLHELGRGLAATPFLASAVLAEGALAHAGDDSGLRSRLASGEAVGTVALAGADGSYEPARRTATWRGDRVDGDAGFVPDADVADVLVVAACDESGTSAVLLVDAAAVAVEPMPTLDETRRLFRVTFDGSDGRHLCEPGPDADALLDRVLALGVIATACDAVGVAERALDMTTAYAKERQQFGRPIGSFQAVKHHCADMAIAVEAGRAAVTAAAEALDGDPARSANAAATAAAITASYVGPAASNVCDLALRVHGGIGFTWEHDCHRPPQAGQARRGAVRQPVLAPSPPRRRRLPGPGDLMSPRTLDEGTIDEVRKRIGIPVRYSPRAHNEVSSTDSFRHFARAYGDDNPLYTDPAYASASSWGSSIAPPLYPFVSGISRKVELSEAEKALLAEGDPLAGIGQYMCGERWIFPRPVRAGDVLWQSQSLHSAELRPSSFGGGTGALVSHRVGWEDDDGAPFAYRFLDFWHADREKSREGGQEPRHRPTALRRRVHRAVRRPLRGRGGPRGRAPHRSPTSRSATSWGPSPRAR